MFKPEKFIRNDELEVHLHTQPCNLMLSTQRVAHPYVMDITTTHTLLFISLKRLPAY